MGIDFEDRSDEVTVEMDDEGDKDIIRAVDDGNAALARTFAQLAEQLELAVEAEKYDKADDLITMIDRLSGMATVAR